MWLNVSHFRLDFVEGGGCVEGWHASFAQHLGGMFMAFLFGKSREDNSGWRLGVSLRDHELAINRGVVIWILQLERELTVKCVSFPSLLLLIPLLWSWWGVCGERSKGRAGHDLCVSEQWKIEVCCIYFGLLAWGWVELRLRRQILDALKYDSYLLSAGFPMTSSDQIPARLI